ncbi:fungal-specific transcription factor domain-containing protein [Mycena sanguinolenta]|nr:fungal-specific transcription factor domain-containing protein [Mycena sanguinolenta]
MSWPAHAPAYTLPFTEYDDPDDDEPDTPGGASTGAKGSKAVRRRSSKACDQCRKSKCKCERPAPGEPCRSCVVLQTECTSLGPSRKRGPPKGYIDAIEARLHQTEALVGIMLAAAHEDEDADAVAKENESDERARQFLADLSEDPLARSILARIDQSAYGPAGRSQPPSFEHPPYSKLQNQDGPASASGSASPVGVGGSGGKLKAMGVDVPRGEGGHPSHEWMDRVTAHVLRRARERRTQSQQNQTQTQQQIRRSSEGAFPHQPPSQHPNAPHSLSHSQSHPHLRASASFEHERYPPPPRQPQMTQAQSRAQRPAIRGWDRDRGADNGRDREWGRGAGDRDKAGGAEGLAGAVGQLSLNEDKQVRYHGKISGLHLLARRRFPKARVWPVAPAVTADDDYAGVGEVDPDGLPPRSAQEALLARYFTHVHPSFPVVHKRAVQDAWARGEGPPPLLLLAMFALAARHAPQPPSSPSSRSPSASPAPSQYMWPAGDAFLFRAKALLDSSYASSRTSTCQALLLMGFREIGIGAMAQAWIYIGMAVRMAQDLGLQRDADGWDGKLFGAWDIAERRRIWYACVIMDKYVSTYIGRPLAIFERDFDTSLPSESDAEELEEWTPPSDSRGSAAPRPGHVISCFNASARLAGILSQIVQSIYALRPASSRHAELVVLDGLLEKWHLALPTHLQHDPARTIRSGVETPLQQVLTLHMQYWCAVLLLHRPFSPAPEDGDVRRNTEQSYELCAGAANHITTIATLYSETYTLKHCAVFLCYYIFTASIMHVTSLSAHPTDPQARMGLTKCMDMLKEMEMIWPAAGRALELLRGAQATLADADDAGSLNGAGGALPSRPRKRPATQPLNDSFAPPPGTTGSNDFIPLRPYAPIYATNGHYGVEPRSAPAAYYPPASSPYDRWPTEAGGGLAFQGALSTAVMGPAYSTGLVEERRAPPPPPHAPEPRFGQPLQQPQQYWNEYTAFPPLGMQEQATFLARFSPVHT